MNPKLPVRRVNPIRVLREQARLEHRRRSPLSSHDGVRPAPNWWAIVPMVLAVLYGAWSTANWWDAEIAQVRAEARAEVQEEVIEDLRHDRDHRTEYQDKGLSLGDLIYSFFTGIFTLLDMIVSGLVDAAQDRKAA